MLLYCLVKRNATLTDNPSIYFISLKFGNSLANMPTNFPSYPRYMTPIVRVLTEIVW